MRTGVVCPFCRGKEPTVLAGGGVSKAHASIKAHLGRDHADVPMASKQSFVARLRLRPYRAVFRELGRQGVTWLNQYYDGLPRRSYPMALLKSGPN